jgi:hypothetical protein
MRRGNFPASSVFIMMSSIIEGVKKFIGDHPEYERIYMNHKDLEDLRSCVTFNSEFDVVTSLAVFQTGLCFFYRTIPIYSHKNREIRNMIKGKILGYVNGVLEPHYIPGMENPDIEEFRKDFMCWQIVNQ